MAHCCQVVYSILQIGVFQAGVALCSQSANLFPVGDKLILLQMDLGGVLGMGLLQARRITAQCVDLVESDEEELTPCGFVVKLSVSLDS